MTDCKIIFVSAGVQDSSEAGTEAVAVMHGTYAWQNHPDSVPTLSDISLSVPKGALCMVVGAVGSGKSSLLAALMHEMYCVCGTSAVRGSLSYAAQVCGVTICTCRRPHADTVAGNTSCCCPCHTVIQKEFQALNHVTMVHRIVSIECAQVPSMWRSGIGHSRANICIQLRSI